MKIAIVNDWIAFIGGAEKVVLEMLKCFPEADLYASVFNLKDTDTKLFANTKVKTTFIQNLPFAKSKFEYYLPLMPIAFEQLDLRDYDIIISSSHAFAKNIITSPEQLHISYVHTPIRYAWDMQNVYLENTPNMKGIRGILARAGLHYLRIADLRSVNAVDKWLCNSNFISERIRKFYNRQAQVIYPPVYINSLAPIVKTNNTEKYYITCSRLVEYKRIDIIVSAFVKDQRRKLIVVGEGPMESKLKTLARKCKNITFTGRVADEEMYKLISNAEAFLYAAKEDFGITPVEAQALGVPVIAYGYAGVLETIVGIDDEAPTGLFFYEQNEDAILEAIEYFEIKHERFVPAICKLNAERFSAQRFRQEFTDVVNKTWREFVGERKL